MARNLILSGGLFHDFDATSAALAQVLADVGVESEITEDITGALSEPSEYQLITVNALRWQAKGFMLPAQARTTLLDHLDKGGGLLCMHAASICFDDWQGWPRVLGACWNWGKSHHPPLGWTSVRVLGGHPIVEGLRDFDLVDEVYSDLDVLPDVQPLASSLGQPLVWARPVRRGRLVYDALGHDVRSYDNEVHHTLLKRAALWLLKRPLVLGTDLQPAGRLRLLGQAAQRVEGFAVQHRAEDRSSRAPQTPVTTRVGNVKPDVGKNFSPPFMDSPSPQLAVVEAVFRPLKTVSKPLCPYHSAGAMKVQWRTSLH